MKSLRELAAQRREGRVMRAPIFALVPMLLATAALAEDDRPHALVKARADFCFMRSYDAAHLKAHPRQIVSSIRIMGRNAWRLEGNERNQLVATAMVTFRDRKEPLFLYGLCFDKPGQPEALKCGFVPDDLQDVLRQTINLKAEDALVHASVSADWRVIRAGQEPDGPYGEPKTDDKTFLLDRKPLEACGASSLYWSAEGAIPELMGKLP